MKINWKVRFNKKNLLFISQIIISIFMPIFAYFGLKLQDITTWSLFGKTLIDAISNPYVVILVIVSAFNAITDPTTRGLSDSVNAIEYLDPK